MYEGFVLGFVRNIPTLAVYYVAYSLPPAGVDRDIAFPEDKTRTISHTSLAL